MMRLCALAFLTTALAQMRKDDVCKSCSGKRITRGVMMMQLATKTPIAQVGEDVQDSQKCIANAQVLGQQQEKHVMRQSDFLSGPYRITEPGWYELSEDIEFEPRPLFPEKNSSLPFGGPNVFGYFTVVSVEASNVLVDLNGHTIKGSEKFNYMQPFFSIITLNNKPFMTNEGPAVFSRQKAEAKVAHNVSIINGVLGFANHMGIHGNRNRNVCIHNLEIKHFGISGVTLNGASGVMISNVSVGPSIGMPQAPKLLATFDLWQAQALLRIVQGGQFENATKIQDLRRAVHNFVDEVLRDRISCDQERLERCNHYPFYNPSGLPRGSALYGISLHREGPGVHKYGTTFEGMYEDLSTRPLVEFVLKNITIHDLGLQNQEVTMMWTDIANQKAGRTGVLGPAYWKPVVDTSVGSLGWHHIVKNGTYQPDVMTEAVRFMGVQKNKWFDDLYANGSAEPEAGSPLHEDMLMTFGATSISHSVLDWMDGQFSFEELVNSTETPVKFKCDLDEMSHNGKGVVGLRLEFLHKVRVEHVVIKGLHSNGKRDPMRQWCHMKPGNLEAPPEDSAYKGWDARGMFWAFSTGSVKQVVVNDVVAVKGHAYGTEFLSSMVRPQSEIVSGALTGPLGTALISDVWGAPSQPPEHVSDLHR